MAEDSLIARYLSEFIGTFLLVLTIGCNILSGGPNAKVWAATSIACVLMVSVYALGGVSGANFNPAVSLALGLSNKLAWGQVAAYIMVQIVAGLLAGFAYSALFWQTFSLSPGPGFSWWEVMIAEVVYTCMLCFVVLNVAASHATERNQFTGLAIGFVIIAGGYAVGNVSGGAFNPAVALGVDIPSSGFSFGWGLLYVCYEFLGAVLATGLYRIVRPDEFGGSRPYSLIVRVCSEFIGTFYLVFTVGMNVLANSMAPAWSIAASLMCMIYALGSVSGAHFNPAVTVAIMASGRNKCAWIDGCCYIITQILAGVAAAFLYVTVHHSKSFPLAAGKISGVGEFGYAGVAFAEITFTFVLCFVVLAVATVKEPSKDLFGLAIGSCVTIGGYAIGSISGGSLNPAVSIGISTSHMVNGGGFYKCLIWCGFELVGALLAAGVFRVTHDKEYSKDLLKS